MSLKKISIAIQRKMFNGFSTEKAVRHTIKEFKLQLSEASILLLINQLESEKDRLMAIYKETNVIGDKEFEQNYGDVKEKN